ncbi:MAG TPA: ribonuclease R [Polyangia bacterium]
MQRFDDDPPARIVTGRIKVHPDGYGFVVPEDQTTEDIHVSARSRGASMDGDKVEVDWWVGGRGLEGRVVKVLERGRGKITGQIGGSGKNVHLIPDDPRITGPVALRGGAGGGRPGEAVVAEIARYPEHPSDTMEVMVKKVLGDPDDPRTEIEKILACADVSEEFPPDVVRAAAHMPSEVRPNDRKDRVDLRHIPFTTIDPETARDFDDAVAIEALPGGGHRLWVAVADVSHYLREGSPIDLEARRRGVSVYLPNRAIPMLPEALSSHMCSLVPNEDRLAMVVRIDFDRDAVVRDTDFAAAVIHSQARLDYPGVAAALSGDVRGKRKKYEPFLPALQTMDTLARKLRAKRFERGSLDLDLPEAVVELDRDDPRLVREVRRSRRDPGERQAYSMIEEFMLAANEAVGDSFQLRGEPVLWRVHDVPSAEKLETFAALAQSYGLPFQLDDVRTPKGLSALLARLKGHAAEKPLSFQLLRSLKQATYDLVNIGHFGLASQAYIQFTSPIRRYPDVVAHRRLKHRLARLGKPAGGFPPLPPDEGVAELGTVAAESSFAERKAMEIEREVVDLYRAFFMRDRIGDVLTGTISAVTNFGVFVAADDPFVEGLIRSEELGDDIFTFDESGLRLVGRRSGHAFALGDSVSIEVLSVSVARRRIDFRLHSRKSMSFARPERGERGRARGRGRERDREREPVRDQLAGAEKPRRKGGRRGLEERPTRGSERSSELPSDRKVVGILGRPRGGKPGTRRPKGPGSAPAGGRRGTKRGPRPR